ncbi:hypothetical protein M0812_06395 [Anaeramoeba flamelloides]|uniref:Ycf1 n=1 Tax=Anaeramoeba flamelloides TaxID=1746091 RepID=A0AAV8A7E5_9EUKA|nr:hypothetical protein M0812_06395 [Anaeramoeba flamelloides]
MASNKKVLICEKKVIDQFGPTFQDLIKMYKTPNAICGYLSPSLALHISENLIPNEEGIVSKEQLGHELELLKKQNTLLNSTEDVMDFIQFDRSAYIEKYSSEFELPIDKRKYLRDWVANYEIGDYLFKYKKNTDIFFVRQPELDFKWFKNEEKRRSEIEKEYYQFPFYFEKLPRSNYNISDSVIDNNMGSRNDQQTTKKKIDQEIENNLKTIHEKQFITEEEWIYLQLYGRENLLDKTYILDLQGHFVVFRFLKVQSSKKKKKKLRRHAMIFNSFHNCKYTRRKVFKLLSLMAIKGNW